MWNEFRDLVCFSVSSIVLRMSKQSLVTSSKDVENFSKTYKIMLSLKIANRVELPQFGCKALRQLAAYSFKRKA